MAIARVDVLGVEISAINMQMARHEIERWIESGEQHYVCVTPAHSVMDCFQAPEYYPLFNCSGLTTPDGMSIAWLLKLKGYRYVERVAGSDLMREILARSVKKGWKHYFYGGAPGTPEKLAQYFAQVYPGVRIVGTHSPPFRDLTLDEERKMLASIRAACPDIIWVGISSPRQEQWMSKHIHNLTAPVLIGVGAAFDFLSGQKKRAPVWMQRTGLEWFFRLVSEPKRLWPRYRLYPLFAFLSAAQMLGLWKTNSTAEGGDDILRGNRISRL